MRLRMRSAHILFFAAEGGERAQRAITKMPRSAPLKAVSRQPSAVGGGPGRARAFALCTLHFALFPLFPQIREIFSFL